MNGEQRNSGDTLRAAVLVLAIMTTGLTAGVFVDWSNTVMPGLSDVDDRTFVEAFRALDAAITNPLFLGVEFTGALLLTGLAVALHHRKEYRPRFVWTLVALGFYLVGLMITFGVHEPLNQKLRDAGNPETAADYAAARAVLEESMWTAWNTVRALTTTIAFGCLAVALAIQPRRRPASQPTPGTPPPPPATWR